MFFRIKKIKGKEYCYIVENEWKQKGSRQSVKGYIGRVYKFGLKNNVGFFEFFKIDNAQTYLESNDKNKIINDLIEWELFRFGVDKSDFSIDLRFQTVQKNRKNVALKINDGFMCNHTLNKLMDFKPEGDEEIDGYRLARAFVESGIKIPEEVFISIFGKLYKS